MVEVKIVGMEKLEAELAAAASLPQGVLKGARDFLHDRMLAVMAEAQEHTPWRTGTLAESGRVETTISNATGIRSVVTFGHEASAYAEVQHEREDFRHQEGRRHHYLYGSSASAWETLRKAVEHDLAEKARELTENALS